MESKLVQEAHPEGQKLSCITNHSGFKPVALVKWTLRMAVTTAHPLITATAYPQRTKSARPKEQSSPKKGTQTKELAQKSNNTGRGPK